MKLRTHLHWLLITLVTLSPAALMAQKDSAAPKTTEEKLVDAIRNSQDAEELEFKLKRAKDSGATPQQLVETRLIWAVVQENWAAAPGYLKPVQDLQADWKRGEALLYKKPAQVQAIGHFIAAMTAHEKDDAATARKEILEAVWLNPEDERIVGAIAKIRPQEQVKVPMDLEIQTADGKATTLAAQMKGKKALYVQVWATWCNPCLALLPVLDLRNRMLPPQGVGVVALNSELGGDDTIGGDLNKAREVRNQKGLNVPWLIDPRDAKSYAQLLELDSVPRALLIDPEGLVIFNDHPVSDDLPKALAKLGAKIDSKKEEDLLREQQ